MGRIITLLPPDAIALLQAAATVGTPGSVKRLSAIEKAEERIRKLYPSYFKEETTNMKVQLQDVRLAFPNLFEPSSIEGSDPKYNAKFIIPANHPQVAELEKAMLEVAKGKWGAKGQQVFDNLTKTGKKPEVGFVKEPYKNRDGDAYDGFEGAFYVTASNKARPLIIDRDRTPLTQADSRPYAGCQVNAIVEFWAQDNSFGRAIRATLKGVQFVRDGDAFGGGAPASIDEFADLGDGADASSLA